MWQIRKLAELLLGTGCDEFKLLLVEWPLHLPPTQLLRVLQFKYPIAKR
jgi:hypothetical protein